MPSAGFAILDDIATMFKHSGTLAAAAAKKTGPLVGDDLAVNAEAMMGINPNRELAIVGQVAKGSAINKVYLILGGLALSAAAPGLIPPILAAGGAFLCYEGYHKTFDKHHDKDGYDAALIDAAVDSKEAVLALEKKKIKQAVTTDVILSAEIVAISLGTVAGMPVAQQLIALSAIGFGMTAGVYGAVAGLVKLDDLALAMMKNTWKNPVGAAIRGIGEFGLKHGVPGLMKTLSVAGTAAMFVVGGEILLHSVPAVHHAVEHALHMLPSSVPLLSTVASYAIGGAAGVAAGLATATGWKLAGPTITRGFSALGKTLSPAIEAAKSANPFKKKPAVVQETDVAPATPLPAVEPAAALSTDLPQPKADLAKSGAKAPQTPAAQETAQTIATSTTLNAHRRL